MFARTLIALAVVAALYLLSGIATIEATVARIAIFLVLGVIACTAIRDVLRARVPDLPPPWEDWA